MTETLDIDLNAEIEEVTRDLNGIKTAAIKRFMTPKIKRTENGLAVARSQYEERLRYIASGSFADEHGMRDDAKRDFEDQVENILESFRDTLSIITETHI